MSLSKGSRRNLGLALLSLVATALAGCGITDPKLPQTVFDPKGPVAQMQYDLLNLTIWLAGGIGLVVSLVLLYVVLRFRAKPGDHEVPKQVHGHTGLEILWTIIPILILVSVTVPSVKAAFTLDSPPVKEALTVRVVAHQWWFEFEYMGLTNESRSDKRVVTANEMVIPVNQPVVLQLESKDVIHSFWVPKLAGKVDLIPNRINKMWLEADEPGEYFGQCAEFCGSAHAKMRFRVIALPQAEYDQWLAARQTAPASPADPVAQKGQQLFVQSCAACHAIDGVKNAQGQEGAIGPNLSNIGARTTLASGVVENNEENLRKWVRNPQTFKSTQKMPNHEAMPAAEFDALILYLRSLTK